MSGPASRALALAAAVACAMALPVYNVVFIVVPLLRSYATDRSPEAASVVLETDAAVVSVDEARRAVRIATRTKEVLLRYWYEHKEVGRMPVGAGGLVRRSVDDRIDIDDARCAFVTYRVGREGVEVRVRLLDNECSVTITARRLPVSAMYEGVRFGVYEIDDYVVLDLRVDEAAEGVAGVVRLPALTADVHEVATSLTWFATAVTAVLVGSVAMTVRSILDEKDVFMFSATLGVMLYALTVIFGEFTLFLLVA